MTEGLDHVAELRREYTTRGLKREDLADDPFAQFRTWFQQAEDAGLLEPNAMTLASVDADGTPSARVVLCKAIEADAGVVRFFVFFTNYDSRKARQMTENGQVALLFTWLPLERQVSITGKVEKISAVESLKYNASRPDGSRVGAWVSHQSQVISSRRVLEEKLHELKTKWSNGEVPLPDFWGGYRVQPDSIEFWQGAANRLHDRFFYNRTEGGTWEIDRLSP